MSQTPDDNLLARLAGHVSDSGGRTAWETLAATEPDDEEQGTEQPEGATDAPPTEDQAGVAEQDPHLEAMVERIQRLAQRRKAEAQAEASAAAGQTPAGWGGDPQSEPAEVFVPVEPESLEEAGLTDSEVEALVLKFLLARGDAVGRDIADQVKLPFVFVDRLLRELKAQQLVVHRGSAPMNDFQYQLTDLGRERARRLSQYCTYFGSAPVVLDDYIRSVGLQSLSRQHPTAEDLAEAFADLMLSPEMLDRLGPAVNSGRGLFLYGPPGNGKTSIAERITTSFGREIWLPRAVTVDGEIIRLFDPVNHEEVPQASNAGLWDGRKIDKRWVRVRRPTILAGGELTMSQLEVTINTATGICEAPLQLKSNCGTLVIDDFGRQRVQIDELLNRWIVPLENRYDFLNLPNGKKIRVPFDQLIIFSTNLEPRDLVDEAFLRRIPYKIEVIDPTERQFRELFERLAPQMGIEYRPEAVDHLIESHYQRTGRPLRFCHPRDLLMQVRNYCIYHHRPLELLPGYIDKAVENYFAVL